MKIATLNRAWQTAGRACFDMRARGIATTAALLLTAFNLFAGATVNWLSGGPNPDESGVSPQGAGYVDGDITTEAEYHTPCGVAIDSTGNYLYVADRDNNAVRMLEFDINWTFHLFGVDQNGNAVTNLFNKPVGVALDQSDDLFVLNRGNGTNGNVLELFSDDTFVTNLVKLVNASGITVDPAGDVFVSASNKVFEVTVGGISNLVATITNAGTSLQGLVFKHNGLIASCDSGNNGVWLINPAATNSYSKLAGFHGAGDFISANNVASSNTAKFFQPMGVAEAGDGTLIVSDYGNHRVKAVLTSGIVTNLYGVTSNDWVTPGPGLLPGFADGTVVVPDQYGGVAARLPNGLAFAYDGTIYVTEDYYHIIRKVTGTGLVLPPPPPPAAPTILTVVTNYGQVSLTWTAVTGASSYNVERSTSTNGPFTVITNITATSFTDTSVFNGTTYYYVVSAVNSANEEGPDSAQVSATPPLPPVPNPQIGYVTFPATANPEYTSVFTPVSSIVLNNDTPIVIEGAAGSQTFYNYGETGSSIPNPTSASYSAPVGYEDGLSPNEVAYYTVAQALPDLTIVAIGEENNGSPNSAVVQARFQFVTGNPLITGFNAAQFMVSDITSNAQMWYTIDGSNPTNAAPSVGPISSGATLSLQFPPGGTNLTFKVIAFRNNYQPSAIVPVVFSPSNYVPNSISFGFASGEASSAFIGSPGQTFFAPVTLSVLPSTLMYSLQFNLTVTNGGAATNAGPPITPGAFGFQSMLMEPVVPAPTNFPAGFDLYTPIPPWMFVNYETNNVPSYLLVTNSTGLVFASLETTNLSENLLAVGWLERYSETNLYDTLSQDLIQYSQAHDDTFVQSAGSVIVGGYSFTIPGNAQTGQQYQIQIGRPSATDDGIGAPGSSVYVYAPTNGSLGEGVINALKVVTVGQFKYLVGDAYPFRWFNAGDFGDTNLNSADVEQVFESAIYGLNTPPASSDFFDSMDSCGNIGVLDGDNTDPNFGDYTNAGAYSSSYSLTTLFNGNDSTIDQVAFGDGQLDVCDVYVTYRRSLDPSRTWFQRFWNNGQRVADTIPNVTPNVAVQSQAAAQSKAQVSPSPTVSPQVNFAAGDALASAGQTAQIPVTANIFGSYPLRVVMLNVTANPLDGSPALTTSVQFTPNKILGTPALTDSTGAGNYAAAWLNSTNAGLTNLATIGTLTVTLPSNVTGSSAYAIHFDHASGSPNGIASFPKSTFTGLITTSSRTNSYYNDGIPDSWRLRWFGTIYNLLSVSNACPSGDGVDNWQKFVAGVDPNVAGDFPSVNPKSPVPSGSTTAIHWPTVLGVQYAILRSTSLFPGSWSAIATNTGTGGDMEFDDNFSGKVKFYRVQILP